MGGCLWENRGLGAFAWGWGCRTEGTVGSEGQWSEVGSSKPDYARVFVPRP